MKANLLVDSRCILGEGPVWDERSNRLWWVDIEGKQLHHYHPESGQHRVFSTPQRVGAFALREAGGLVVAADNGWYTCDEEDGGWSAIADPEPDYPHHRFNDGKCDASGRFYAGTYSLQNRPEASLYILRPDMSWERLVSGITCSNGLAWSPDNRVMYYIDSPTRCIDRFDVDPIDGKLTNRRTAVRIEEEAIVPDGMTADEEGNLWVAEWGGWKVSRFNPYTGERLQTIDVPVRNVTSCTFGGRDMDELFITTASIGVTEESRQDQPHAGSVFHVKVGVKGRPSYRFGAK